MDRSVQRSAGCSFDSSHMEAPHSTLSVRVNSGMKVFKKCTRTHFTGHFTVRFWIKPFFKYPNITVKMIQRRLRSWTPISQLTNQNTSPSQASFYYHEILKTQQHERHDSLSAGRLLNMDQLTRVHTCLCVCVLYTVTSSHRASFK